MFILFTPAHADECIPLDIYHSAFSSKGITLFGSRAAETQQIGAAINKNRASVGNSKIEISILVVGYVKDNAGDAFAIVGVFDDNGCLIQDTLSTLTLKQWIDFLESAGVDPKSFVEIYGA